MVAEIKPIEVSHLEEPKDIIFWKRKYISREEAKEMWPSDEKFSHNNRLKLMDDTSGVNEELLGPV